MIKKDGAGACLLSYALRDYHTPVKIAATTAVLYLLRIRALHSAVASGALNYKTDTPRVRIGRAAASQLTGAFLVIPAVHLDHDGLSVLQIMY